MNVNISNKIYKLIKIVSLFVLLTLATFINDTCIAIYFSPYNNEFRLIDHLVAGFCIPIIAYFSLGEFYKKCIFYFEWSTCWEISQYISRGYFQYSQYMFDLLGIGLAICIYKGMMS